MSNRIRGLLCFDDLKQGTDHPKLRAKAAATRCAAPFAALLAHEFNSGSEHDERRAAVADSLVRFYELLSHGQFSTAIKAELPTVGSRLCRLYALLSCEALDAEVVAWQLVPKFHVFLHLCLTQAIQWGNPRFFWTYADEDMVGHMIAVAKSCHNVTMPTIALYKWLSIMFD